MTQERIVHRPRKRAAAVYSLILIAVLYAVYKLASPGFPLTLLLAPVLFGHGLITAFLASIGLEEGVGRSIANGLSWTAGALVLWYVYYKLVYFLLWLFGIHQPLMASDEDQGAEPVVYNEGGWLTRVIVISILPILVLAFVWSRATSYEGQHSRQHHIVLTAVDASCKGKATCRERIDRHFGECFETHFVRQGRKWLRPRYEVDREPFRACLFPGGPD